MSQRSRNRSRRQNNDSDDSGEEYSQRQFQSQHQNFASVQVQNKMAGQLCNLLLVGEMKKIPVKSADIRKTILRTKTKSVFKNVMEKAQERMEHVFGYKIVPLKDNCFILVNAMVPEFAKYQQLSKDEKIKRGLLITIVTAIFMNEEKISAGELESFLNALEDDLFTVSKNVIQEFIKQKYLDTSIETSTDPPTLMYYWGDRAEAEFSKKEILEYACKVYGNDMKPSMWTYQWKVVNGGGESSQ